MDSTTERTSLTSPRANGRAAPGLAFFVLLTAMSVLPVNIHLPALPDIAHTFGASFALVNRCATSTPSRSSPSASPWESETA
ncbi:hypothetical protein [Micromonospora haikouensis]|uniref:hypothetical protein n=1 Tax=Micromonospora haikouensis TaxID=686309 RepID=UPI003D75B16D